MLLPLFGFPLAAIALTQPIPQQIHVKVFPHLFNNPPEGRDVDPAHVTLKSASACTIYDGETDTAASTGKIQSQVSSLNLTLTSAALKSPLWIQCDGAITVVRKGAAVNYSYSEPIYLHAVRTGPELVAVMTMNDYLRGVVPAEMPHTWPAEALKAQAVAARTYASYHVLQSRAANDGGFFDVDDTVLYQAFTGNNSRTTQTDQAIQATGSTVILYQGAIIQAYFSADAGGYTEDASHVWPVVAPFCVSKPEIYTDPTLDGGEWGPWLATFTLSEVDERLQAAGLLPAGVRIVNARIEEQNIYVSGRAKAITLDLTTGASMEIDGLRFRSELGLKSTLFTLAVTPSHDLEIHGKGFGHGAGMSQFGARLLAMLGGWDYQQILHFYYTDVDLTDSSND